MTVQETKWNEVAVSEAIESAANTETSLRLDTSELIDYVNNYVYISKCIRGPGAESPHL